LSDGIHLILILGAAQGFFLTILIFHKYSDLYANRFLGGIMLMMSIILIHLVLDELDVYTSIPLLKYLIETLPLLIGPMHYLYARALMQNEKYSLKVLWPHALPALIYLVYRIFFLLFSSGAYMDGESDPVYIVYNWMINIQALIYMLVVLRMINSYTHSLKDMFAALENVKLTWLRNISLLMTSLLIIFLMENVLFLIHINFSHFFNLTSTIMAVSVYALGYMGVSRSEVFLSQEIATPISQLPQMETATKSAAYEKSGLSEEKAKEYKKQLIAVMDNEKLFRDSNLTLSKVAEKLSISTHNLSEVINKQIKMNFFDFVNAYRVQQVKKDLLDKEKENLTLIAIAFDAGFNSKSSFNAIFKKHTGKTPSEFRK
jgi:AraC-like DNA-binding protein